MQKFVVAKKSSDVPQEKTTQNQAKVQMSGYLKKKRNKVGGWRKMWFVLQNQLLLSYNSKEEYNKKLVCFKDVINLVPGTIVRPLGGFRFTIETTTDTIFTFRCDDSKSCTNWITALIESLSMQGQCAKENGLRIKPKLNASLDNIRQMRPKRIVRTSYSWDSICQSSKNAANKLPKIPIAQNTARILKRTGVDINKSHENYEMKIHHQKERARNFRLHDKRLQSEEQSIEVCRINRMFVTQNQNSKSQQNHQQQQNSGCSTTNNVAFNSIVTSSTTNTSGCNASAASVNTTTNTTRTSTSPLKTNPSDATKPVTIAQARVDNIDFVPVLKDKFRRFCSMNVAQLAADSTEIVDNKQRKCKDNEFFRDLNRNKMTEKCESSLEDQIQRLTLKDSSGLMMDPTFLHHNHQRNSITQKKLNGEAYVQHHPHHHHRHHQYHQKQYNNGINRGVENVYNDDDVDVVGDEDDADGDDSPMNAVPHLPYGPLNFQDILSTTSSNELKLFPRLSASSENVNMRSGEHVERVEPIYAVVDLKNKYARRAKLRELEEGMMLEQQLHQASTNDLMTSEQIDGEKEKRERPKSIHVVSSDYEEVLNFSNDCLDKDDEENENIYEPINIPEGSHNHHHHHHHHTHSRNLMWRYFPRINIEALIDMTRSRKKDSKLEPQSPFSDIRRKFGNHRKSIKIRMKRFYSKESPSITFKERNAFSDDELDSQGATGSNSGTSDNSIKSSCGNIEKPSASYVFNEIEKYRKGEKQIFGSLSRLKKTRTSLCIEDNIVNGQKLLVTPKSACFQQEIRRDISKRTGTKKTVCHSKFYD